MWYEHMDTEGYGDIELNKRIEQEVELEEKIFRISHPILAKLDDARIGIARKILGL